MYVCVTQALSSPLRIKLMKDTTLTRMRMASAAPKPMMILFLNVIEYTGKQSPPKASEEKNGRPNLEF
jgi:hypothetical protein